MNKKYIGASCIIAAVVIWLLCANRVIAFFSDGIIPQVVSFDRWCGSGNARGAIDFVQNSDDMLGTNLVGGWVFVETEESNSNRAVSLILKNELICYEAPLLPEDKDDCWTLQHRDDVRTAFQECSIPSAYIGFYFDLVTYSMRDGTYDIYIYCWENESNQGIVHTDRQFVKEGDNISLRQWQSSEASLDQSPVENETVTTWWDGTTLQDQTFRLSGWAFTPELDCGTQVVYVSVGGKMYTTMPVPREDVAKAYRNDSYVNSGFGAFIPAENLPKGESEIQIFIENDGTLYSGEPIPVIRNGDEVQIKKAVFPPSWQSEAITLGSQPMEGETAKSYIDSFTVEDGTVSISGWGFQPGLDSETQTVYLKINGITYTTQHQPRQDVARVFENDLYATSGFQALIPVDSIPEGELDVQVLIENSGGLYSGNPIKIQNDWN